MSGNLPFIFDRPIIFKTIKYSDQFDNISWYVLNMMGSSLIGQYMNADVNTCRISFIVNVSSNKKNQEKYKETTDFI
jgi:hypothetical protein